ncbi:MAG: ABC transporter permease [Gemmatimonadetes bacterium]|nr:ABC transporter permease [Gemmatimonadota bacterium]
MARREFGNVGQVKELAHLEGSLPLLEVAGRNLRLAARGLLRESSFTLLCILTLGVAIGANSAIFSVVNAVLLRPLPYPEADRLVQVWETNPLANRWGDWASYPDVIDWNRESRSFDGMAAFRYGRFRLSKGPYPEMLTGLRVSPELLSVLRVNPMIGRPFLAEEGNEGRNDVAVVSYGLWQRQFGSDRSLIGRTVLLDGRAFLVVGVMPPGFNFPADLQGGGRAPDLWIPVGADRDRGSHNYRVIARLKHGRTVEQAQSEMDRLVKLVAHVDPGHQGRGGAAAGLQQHTAAAVRPALVILVGAILLVLLIACANVASLLLARGATRQKQIALRLALGAGAKEVLAEGLTESLVLSLLAGGAGLVVAFAGIHFLVEFGPPVPLVRGARIDLRVLLFTLLVALTTGIGFGIVPTVQALKVRANDVLKEIGPRLTGSASRSRIRTVLTTAEIALALMLLIGAGLLVRSFTRLGSVDPGFDRANLLTAFLSAAPEVSAEPERTARFFEEVISRIERVPGVRAAAGASAVPLLSNETSPFRLDGMRDPGVGQDIVYAEQPKITATYFETMGIPLIRGRVFTAFDNRQSVPVAIVSESLAKRYWPGQDPIGQRVSIDDQQWRSVVAVVGDVHHDGLDQPIRPTIYIPITQYPRPSLALLVRTDVDPALVIDAVRRAVTEVDRNQPLFGIQTMEQALNDSVSLRRFLMILVGLFAGVALVLGTVGVYGVLAYFVSLRRREIGIRIALGANRLSVTQLVLKQGMLVGGIGIGIGVLGALALSRVLSGVLFGVSTTDVWTFSIVPALLFVIVLMAALLPARRAANVAPMTALRSD